MRAFFALLGLAMVGLVYYGSIDKFGALQGAALASAWMVTCAVLHRD